MDATHITSALVKLADNRELLSEQSKNCMNFVEKNYSWDVTARTVETLLAVTDA